MATATERREVTHEAKRGIILDIGCGESKHPGSVGMDHQDRKGVDVVHNWDEFPWPFEDESCLTILASHVVEHVNPVNGHFLNWMNECWRILKPERQIAIVTPYGSSSFYVQDPTHCNPCNERTWWYFDPEHPSGLYPFYEPAPWEIQLNTFHSEGMLEIVMAKRLDKPEYHTDGKVHWS